MAMSEYEWETPRVPRVKGGSGGGLSPRASRPIDHYVALEFPRESAAWVLGGPMTEERTTERAPSARAKGRPEGPNRA
jgi:hypothetical protein